MFNNTTTITHLDARIETAHEIWECLLNKRHLLETPDNANITVIMCPPPQREIKEPFSKAKQDLLDEVTNGTQGLETTIPYRDLKKFCMQIKKKHRITESRFSLTSQFTELQKFLTDFDRIKSLFYPLDYTNVCEKIESLEKHLETLKTHLVENPKEYNFLDKLKSAYFILVPKLLKHLQKIKIIHREIDTFFSINPDPEQQYTPEFPIQAGLIIAKKIHRQQMFSQQTEPSIDSANIAAPAEKTKKVAQKPIQAPTTGLFNPTPKKPAQTEHSTEEKKLIAAGVKNDLDSATDTSDHKFFDTSFHHKKTFTPPSEKKHADRIHSLLGL